MSEQLLDEVIEKTERIIHPAAAHIPPERLVARCAESYPWRAVGSRIILVMLKGEDRRSVGGIWMPDIAQGRGKDKQLTTGLVVAHGAGDFNFAGHFVSPEHDYGVTLSDVVFVEPNSGVIIMDDDNEYRVIQPHDIIMVGRRDIGKKTREKLLAIAERMLAKYVDQDAALHGMAPDPRSKSGFDPDPFEVEVEAAREAVREIRGKATKTQVVVPAKEK